METALWLFLVSEVMIDFDTKVLDYDRRGKFQMIKLFGVGMSAKSEWLRRERDFKLDIMSYGNEIYIVT